MGEILENAEMPEEVLVKSTSRVVWHERRASTSTILLRVHLLHAGRKFGKPGCSRVFYMQLDLITSSQSQNRDTMESDGAQSVALVQRDDIHYHPLFSSPDADIVLAAKGASVYFRLHSHNLKIASGFFRQMFMLPQNTQLDNNGILYLEEDEVTLENLFRMISGLSVPPIDSYDLVDPLLDAIEKYDTPGPLSIVRLLVMTPALLNEPFRLYAVACRFGWDDEAQYASSQTLAYDLHCPDVRPYLTRLSTNALLRLLDLHRSRREGLRQRLDDPPFVSGGLATCNNCNSTIDYHTWRELKYKIILEMDVRPLGDSISDEGLTDWSEAKACWQAKCGQPGCSRSLYDKSETLRVIRECIEKLPKMISLS